MKIAGHTACVNALFESTPLYFGAYLTEEAPEFSVTVTREDIAFEQQDLLEEALRDEQFGHELLADTTFLQLLVALNRDILQDHTSEQTDS